MPWYVFSILAASPASAERPVGTKMEEAAVVDITTSGLDLVETLAPSFLPSFIDVPPFDESGEECFLFVCASYEARANDLIAFIDIDHLTLTPGDGTLNLDAAIIVTVNSAAAPGHLFYDATAIPSDTCSVWVEPVRVDLSGTVQLDLVPDPLGKDIDGDSLSDTKRFDATIPAPTWAWDLDTGDIQVRDCSLNTINDILDFLLGIDLYELVIDEVEPIVDDLVRTLPAELEPLIEDAASGLALNEEVDLLGTPLSLAIWPDELRISQDGVRVSLGSFVDVPIHDCVLPYGIAGSVETDGAPPPMSHPASPFPDPQAVAAIDDDLMNHILYAAWASGLMCLDLGAPDSPLSLPIPIDTNLLGPLSGGAFDHLFPDPVPISMVTEPRVPPVVDLEGPNEINVLLDPMGIGFYGEVDDRRVRLANIDLVADIGVDLAYDGQTGDLGIEVIAGGGAVVPTVTYNEIAPDGSDDIEDGFGALFDTLTAPLLTSFADDLALTIPSFEGIGLTDLSVVPTGDGNEFLGAYGRAGRVDFASGGCDKSGGCDTSGCSGGCSTSAPAGGLAFLLFPLMVAVLRRH